MSEIHKQVQASVVGRVHWLEGGVAYCVFRTACGALATAHNKHQYWRYVTCLACLQYREPKRRSGDDVSERPQKRFEFRYWSDVPRDDVPGYATIDIGSDIALEYINGDPVVTIGDLQVEDVFFTGRGRTTVASLLIAMGRRLGVSLSHDPPNKVHPYRPEPDTDAT